MEDKINELILVVSYIIKALPEKVMSTQMRGALAERLEAILRDTAR